MNKIILVQINHSEDHSEKVLPLGILSVGSALKKGGFEPELINITEKEIEKIATLIVSKNPLYIGLSVMTGRQTMHSANLSKKIKKLSPSLPVVWGGIHPSLLPEQCLSEEYIDYVVIGEGEETSVEFSKKLQNKEPLEGVLGLGYKKEGRPKINPPRPLIKDLSPWTLDFGLLDLEKFIYPLDKYKRVMAYKTSRGCPFNCAFCYNREFNQNRWRAWPLEQVVSDIEFLKNKYKIDAIKFYDDNFIVDRKRAMEILRRINLPVHLEARIDMIDETLAKEFKERKVFDILIGVESGSDRILSLINKKITVEQILNAVKILSKYDIPASYSAIVGLPTETKAEFESTIELFYRIYKIHSKSVITLGAYMPYPGSAMYEFAQKHGFVPPAKTEEWGKIDRFRKDFSSPWVNGRRVWRIREYFKLLKFKLGPVNRWFEWRIRHRMFALPLDIYFVEWLSGLAIEEKNWFGRTLRYVYNLIKSRNQTNMATYVNFNKGKLLSGRIYPEFFPINKEETVLNIGCGDGVQAVIYGGNFKKMTGIDINENRLEMARKLAASCGSINFTAVCANVEEIPLSEKYDKVIAIDIIEHVIHPEKVLEGIWRLIEDKGELLITFPVLHDKWENFFRFVGRKILRRKGKTVRLEGWDPDEHQYDYKLKEWFKLLDKKGFLVSKYRATTMFPPLHYLGVPRFWFSNDLIHKIDGFFCKLPLFRDIGQSAVCIVKKK